jgi:hypothetical protein
VSDPKDPWSAEEKEPRKQRAARTEIMNRGVDPSGITRPRDERPELGFDAEVRTEVLQTGDDVEERLAAVADLPTQYELETLQRPPEPQEEAALGEEPNPALEDATVDEMDVPRGEPAANPWESQGKIDLTPQPGPKVGGADSGPRPAERTAMIPEEMRAEALSFDLSPPPVAPETRGPPIVMAAVVALVLFGAALGIAAVLFGGEKESVTVEALPDEPAPDEPAPDEPAPDEPAPDEPAPGEDPAPVTADAGAPADAPKGEKPADDGPTHATADPSWKGKTVEFSVARVKGKLPTRLRTTFLRVLKSDESAKWKFKRRRTRKGVKVELGLGDIDVEETGGELVVKAHCFATGDAKWRTTEVTANAKVSTGAPAPPGLLDELKRDATSACARRLAVTFVPGMLKDPAP